jgi:hypothetical protein
VPLDKGARCTFEGFTSGFVGVYAISSQGRARDIAFPFISRLNLYGFGGA